MTESPQTQWVPLDSRRKKLKRLNDRDKLDRLIAWYEQFKPEMERRMPVAIDGEQLDKWAARTEGGTWLYRGWTLTQAEVPVVKKTRIAK